MYRYLPFCRSIQTNNDGLSATWDLAGDPCPVKKQEWAVYSADRQQVIQNTIIEPGAVILLNDSIKTCKHGSKICYWASKVGGATINS